MLVRDLLLVPSSRWLFAGGGVLAVLAAVTLARDDAGPTDAPALALEAREPMAAVREVALEDEVEEPEPEPEAADPHASIRPMEPIEDPADFTFVVEIGGTTYIRIARGEDAVIDAERDLAEAKLFQGDVVASAVAPFPASALPEELRRWRGRRVLVNGTCAAKVVAFAEIAQASGDPPSESDDGDPTGARWTVETTFASGRTMIAGALDRRCAGSWARAADRPAVGRAIAVDAPGLRAAARGAFLASTHIAVIEDGWREAKQAGDWRDLATLEVRIVKHSITGARWAYVHARKPGGCGAHDVNVAATYRIADDGALAEIETADFPGHALEALVDLNGDGWFERLVVSEGGADHTLVGPADSEDLASIDVPVRGCGC